MRILLAINDSILARTVANAFDHAGAVVDGVASASRAVAAIASSEFDLVIFEAGHMAPLLLEALNRRQGAARPLRSIGLMRFAHEYACSAILDGGADDVLFEPIDAEELRARARALCRRLPDGRLAPTRFGPMVLDLDGHVAYLGGKRVDLTNREISIIRILMGRNGSPVSKSSLMDLLFSWGEDVTVNAVEAAIHRLRRKVRNSSVEIVSRRRVGYCLSIADGSDAA